MSHSADCVLSECRNIRVRWHLENLTLGSKTLCPSIVSIQIEDKTKQNVAYSAPLANKCAFRNVL